MEYGTPKITDLGSVKELTANDGVPQVVDVPLGTPVGMGNIVGTNPNPPMS